jgi:hypothetical protein
MLADAEELLGYVRNLLNDGERQRIEADLERLRSAIASKDRLAGAIERLKHSASWMLERLE